MNVMKVILIHRGFEPVAAYVFYRKDRQARTRHRAGVEFSFGNQSIEWRTNACVLKPSSRLCQRSFCLLLARARQISPRKRRLLTGFDLVELLRADGFLLVKVLISVER